MAKDRYKLLAAANLVLIKDQKILLARRCNTGWGDGLFCVPAGHLEANETISQAMAREAQEELGIELDPASLKCLLVMHRHSDADRIDFFFTTEKWAGQPKNMEPEKCDSLEWFSLNRLPKNTVEYVKTGLELINQGKFFVEFNWQET